MRLNDSIAKEMLPILEGSTHISVELSSGCKDDYMQIYVWKEFTEIMASYRIANTGEQTYKQMMPLIVEGLLLDHLTR